MFGDRHPARYFASVCPSAVDEVCTITDLPNFKGYCTSKFFNDYWFITHIELTLDRALKSAIYEMFTRIHRLIRPYAEFYHLWSFLSKGAKNNIICVQVAEKESTSTDRVFGCYYLVQFQETRTRPRKSYVYHLSKPIGMWGFAEMLRKEYDGVFDSKAVSVDNDKEGLDPSRFSDGKYHIFVKAVEQEFTSEESNQRVTVFERNYNVSSFSFSIPSRETSMRKMRQRKTVIAIPHSVPYIEPRIEVSEHDINVVELSPIECSCLNIHKKAYELSEAIRARDIGNVSAQIQGAILTQVNAGPLLIAEVFLSGTVEDEHTAALRSELRELLNLLEQGLRLHREVSGKDPKYKRPQEQMDNQFPVLVSKFQPYLK